ncbi:RagB/SusD family nutrient uptake outer membrane protein [Niabella yanshanensis]|uniref:RagB/SusD family nutrient uptake outer membrane protein n=1 Tax=Niabella yanshanensis TaxID=577386 RepID=A0ABZ0WCX3_9BACT|nr:RagB/SusD family nutrient uptake outer membrane protein [Niabella yanshanensis]WQD40300.1 RagB/SusD family nutrient uptake outer membrane protein [Niabella yanshanensis]
MNTRKIVAFALLTGLTFQSCSKLDSPPTDFIDPTKAFRNLDDLNMGVLGTYAVLTSTLIEASAIVSDEVMYPTENTVSNNTAHRWLYNSTSGSVTSAFYEYYEVIDRANRVLEAISVIKVGAAGQSRLDQYHAEMLAVKAYSHFELLKAYASSYEPDGMGVPYMKERKVGYPARESVKSNFDNINADLKAAKELMSPGFNDNTRITRSGIAAIQARVALYEKKWSDAVTYASEVIAAEPLAPKSDFSKIWDDNSQSEVIWKLARVIGDSRLGAAFFRETGEIVLYAPSFKLIDQFGTVAQRADDVRFDSYIQYAPARPAGKSQYLVNKYVGGDAAYRGLTAVKLFRAGEMYLIKAEAELENTNGTAAIAAAAKDLNDLRRARIYNYIDQNFTDKQSLLNAIYNERFKELAFEGHRFFDLKRRNLPVERTTQDAINTSGAVRLDPTAAQYCFPIAANEMSVNKNMIQNPNY